MIDFIPPIDDRRISDSEVDQHDNELYDLLESTPLKDCPFCAENDIKIATHLRGVEGNYFHLYSIRCCNCNVTNTFEKPSEMWKWWNYRELYDD